MVDVVMPQLSDSMEDGVIVVWLIEEGQPVSLGEDLVEIETDKTSVTQVSEADGLLQILMPEGSRCTVGQLIARIGVWDGTAQVVSTSGNVDRVETSTPDTGSQSSSVVGRPSLEVNFSPSSGPRATPLARRAAVNYGVSLESLEPTGPSGTVSYSDVLNSAGVSILPRPADRIVHAARPGEAGSNDGVAQGFDRGNSHVQKLTRIQEVIAERMTTANAIPAFQLHREAIFDEVVALRKRLRKTADRQVVPSLNDFVIKACGLALRKVPLANASFTTEGCEYHDRVNVGFAVATEDSLIVPTVFDADTKSLIEVAGETRTLAKRCRASTISPNEISGGTFTVSNLGMYGISAMTPIINPPQAAILGVGALRNALTRASDELKDETSVTLTLSCDHRIVYGADAAQLLSEICDLLESPLLLLSH
jgi:pyruvate dehydrogenase E2 component (dihydrolipoamide acetyltransferase)